MRTTINLEDDALALAKAYARARALKLGPAISEIIRRGNEVKLPIKNVKGVWVFELPADTPKVTARLVQQLLEEGA